MGTGTISRPDERTSSDGCSQSFPAKSQEITAVDRETYPRFVWIDVHSLEFPRIPTVFTTLFVRFLVLVLESIQYSNPTFWSASSREPPRSTIGIAAVRIAIEYEYRFTEYRPPRRTEYEYDEIRCEARPMADRLG
jgi:hypothetical protein